MRNFVIILLIVTVVNLISVNVDLHKIIDIPISNPACLGLTIENNVVFSPGFKSFQYYEINENLHELSLLENFYVPGEMIYTAIIDQNNVYALTNRNFGYDDTLYKIDRNSEDSATILDSLVISNIFYKLYQSNTYLFVYSISSRLLLNKENFEVIEEFYYNDTNYMALINDSVIISMDNDLLTFHDISDLNNITYISSIDVETSGNNMFKMFGTNLFYANNGMIYIIDLSDLTNPEILYSYYLNDTIYLDALIYSDKLVMTTMQNIYVFSLDDDITLEETIFQINFPKGLSLNNQFTYVAYTSGDFKAFDFNDNFEEVNFQNITGAITTLIRCGDYLHVGLRDAANTGVLTYDVSDFSNPIFIDNYWSDYKDVNRIKSTEHFLSFVSQNSSIILNSNEINSPPLVTMSSKIKNIIETEDTLLAFTSEPNRLIRYSVFDNETLIYDNQQSLDFPQNSILVDAFKINNNFLLLGSVGEIILVDQDLNMLDYYYNSNLPPFNIQTYDSGSIINDNLLYICLNDGVAAFNILLDEIDFIGIIETNNKYTGRSLTIKDNFLIIGHWGYLEFYDINNPLDPTFTEEVSIDHGSTCLVFNSDSTKFISSGGAYLTSYDLSINNSFVSDDIISSELFIRNYPNPFNPSTTFEYIIKKDGLVEIAIFNVKGQLVNTIVDKFQTSGFHNSHWDGSDYSHMPVSSGIYYYKLLLDKKVLSIGKCVLLK